MTIGKAGPRAGQTSRVSLTGDLVVQTSRISGGRGDPNTTLLRHPCTGDCLSHLLQFLQVEIRSHGNHIASRTSQGREHVN